MKEKTKEELDKETEMWSKDLDITDDDLDTDDYGSSNEAMAEVDRRFAAVMKRREEEARKAKSGE